MDHQNWDTVYLWAQNIDIKETKEKNNNKNTNVKKENMELKKELKIEKKIEEGNMKIQKVDKKKSLSIQQKRMNKGWTRKELAKKINVQENIITGIETGKGKYNPQIMNKLNRIFK